MGVPNVLSRKIPKIGEVEIAEGKILKKKIQEGNIRKRGNLGGGKFGWRKFRKEQVRGAIL